MLITQCTPYSTSPHDLDMMRLDQAKSRHEVFEFDPCEGFCEAISQNFFGGHVDDVDLFIANVITDHMVF